MCLLEPLDDRFWVAGEDASKHERAAVRDGAGIGLLPEEGRRTVVSALLPRHHFVVDGETTCHLWREIRICADIFFFTCYTLIFHSYFISATYIQRTNIYKFRFTIHIWPKEFTSCFTLLGMSREQVSILLLTNPAVYRSSAVLFRSSSISSSMTSVKRRRSCTMGILCSRDVSEEEADTPEELT